MRKPPRHEHYIHRTDEPLRTLTAGQKDNLLNHKLALGTRAAIEALYIAKLSLDDQLQRFGNVVVSEENKKEVIADLEKRLKHAAKREGVNKNLLKTLINQNEKIHQAQLDQYNEESKQLESDLEEELQNIRILEKESAEASANADQLADILADLGQIEEKMIEAKILSGETFEIESGQVEVKNDGDVNALDSQLQELEALAEEENNRAELKAITDELANDFTALGAEIDEAKVTMSDSASTQQNSSKTSQRLQSVANEMQQIHEKSVESVQKMAEEFLASLEEKKEVTAPPQIHVESEQTEAQNEEKSTVNNELSSKREFAPGTRMSITKLYFATRSNEEQLQGFGAVIAPDGPAKQKFVKKIADELAQVARHEVNPEQLVELIKEYKNERASMNQSPPDTTIETIPQSISTSTVAVSENPPVSQPEAKGTDMGNAMAASAIDIDNISQDDLDLLERTNASVQEGKVSDVQSPNENGEEQGEEVVAGQFPKDKVEADEENVTSDEAQEEKREQNNESVIKSQENAAIQTPPPYKEAFDKGTGEDAMRRISETLKNFDSNFHVGDIIKSENKGDLRFDLKILKGSAEYKGLDQDIKEKIDKLSDKCEKAYNSSFKIAQSFLKGQVRNMIGEAKQPNGLLDALNKEINKMDNQQGKAEEVESKSVESPRPK